MSEIEIITIQDQKGSHSLIHFTCVTCKQEKYGEITKKNAQTLLRIMRGGTVVYPYCSTCEAPDMPDDDSLSISFRIVTVQESMDRLLSSINREKNRLQDEIDMAIREKNRLLESLKGYQEKMKRQRIKVKDIENMVRKTDRLISDVQKTLNDSMSDVEKNINGIKKWHDTVVKE